MNAPGAEVASRDECLRADLMLDIKRPTLHIGSLKIRINAGDVLNRQVDCGSSGKRIVECSGVNHYLLLEWRVSCDQIRLSKTERQLIEVDAVSSPDRSRSFLKRVPGDSHSRREIVACRRDGLAKR